jgi:LysM repeat protein
MNREEALKILKLSYKASQSEIKASYRDLAMVWHPDRFKSGSRLQAKAEEELKQINSAYEFLKMNSWGSGSQGEKKRDERKPYKEKTQKSSDRRDTKDGNNKSSQDYSSRAERSSNPINISSSWKQFLIGISIILLIATMWSIFPSEEESEKPRVSSKSQVVAKIPRETPVINSPPTSESSNKNIDDQSEPGAYRKFTYTVKYGDTMGQIAENHNTSAKRIRYWNGLSYGQHIYPSQKLIVYIDNKSNNEQIRKIASESFVESSLPPAKTTGKNIDKKNDAGAYTKKIYTVKKGDTLGQIAANYNTSARRIRYWNSLSYGQHIFVGQKLTVYVPNGQ